MVASYDGDVSMEVDHVAGRIVYGARAVVLKLAVDAERLELFHQIRRDCFASCFVT